MERRGLGCNPLSPSAAQRWPDIAAGSAEIKPCSELAGELAAWVPLSF